MLHLDVASIARHGISLHYLIDFDTEICEGFSGPTATTPKLSNVDLVHVAHDDEVSRGNGFLEGSHGVVDGQR